MTKERRVELVNRVWHTAENNYAANRDGDAVHDQVCEYVEGAVGEYVYRRAAATLFAALQGSR